MKSIGIRVTPKKIYYTLAELDGDSVQLLLNDSIIVPVSMKRPDSLNYIRKSFFDIINQHFINLACIKATEGNSKNINIERLYIEGVVQELFSGSSIEKYHVANHSMMSRLLGVKSFKDLLNNKSVPGEYKSIVEEKKNKEAKESIFAALAAFN